jgi:hypothetical protein
MMQTEFHHAVPVSEYFDGWWEDISKARRLDELPSGTWAARIGTTGWRHPPTGVKVTGCTVLVVDEGVDSGPIRARAALPAADDDDEATAHERIKAAERAQLAGTVGRIVHEGWSVHGRRVRIGS